MYKNPLQNSTICKSKEQIMTANDDKNSILFIYMSSRRIVQIYFVSVSLYD